MPAHRFFFDQPLQKGKAVLAGPELHHLQTVMRLRPGESVELVDGKGALAQAQAMEVNKSEVIFEILDVFQAPFPTFSLILAQAFTRPSLLDWIIEKGTELGVTRFWLFPAEGSDKKELTPHQLQRLEHLAISGLKQSGRLYLPSLEVKPPLPSWKKPEGLCFYGSLSKIAKPFHGPLSSPVIMVIGPEKGFSAQEQTVLETHLHAQGISLHPNILRAETAALCALSQLSYLSILDQPQNH